MSGITTHILDTSLGRPAAGVPVRLEVADAASGGWRELGRGTTDADGRCRTLVPAGTTIAVGVHRLVFDTAAYFTARGTGGFYPEVAITFSIRQPAEHHHVPLLLAPFGYSTYRGS